MAPSLSPAWTPQDGRAHTLCLGCEPPWLRLPLSGKLYPATPHHLPGPTGFPCQPLAARGNLQALMGRSFPSRTGDQISEALPSSCPTLCPSQALGPSGKPDPTAVALTPPAVSRPLSTVPDPREQASVPPPTAATSVPALGGRGLHQTPGGPSLGRGVAGRATGAVGSEPGPPELQGGGAAQGHLLYL